jgi:hypothetical protein
MKLMKVLTKKRNRRDRNKREPTTEMHDDGI